MVKFFLWSFFCFCFCFILFYFLTSLLEYNCFTMVCQFLLYNKVNQLYIYIYHHISSILRLPPTLPIPPLQVVTKHQADLPVLCGCFPLVIYFTFGSIYKFGVFFVALGLRCCARAFSSCSEQGLLFVAVRGLLIAVASLLVRTWALGTQASVVGACRLSSCGTWAQLLHSMQDLPRPGIESMSPALAGSFLTTAPPGKPLVKFFEATMSSSGFCHIICGMLHPFGMWPEN